MSHFKFLPTFQHFRNGMLWHSLRPQKGRLILPRLLFSVHGHDVKGCRCGYISCAVFVLVTTRRTLASWKFFFLLVLRHDD